MLGLVLVSLVISGLWCQNIERVVVSQGEPFSFDCQQDQSVYFGRKINEWSEIQENSDNYLELNFNYLSQDNLLRVSSNSAQAKHVGFYACRKSTWTTASMNSVYQLVLADVQSFYWTFVCHGPIGSCQRSDDIVDDNLSQFEVADQTNVELFCCASVTGYRTVDIHMNQVGELRDRVEVNKKQELDGAWVVCASQRTIFKRTPYSNRQTLTCELLTDDRRHSTLSSVITMKDAILPDPSSGYTFYSEDSQRDPSFNRHMEILGRPRRKLSARKKLAIILGSTFGGLILLGLAICLVICVRGNKSRASRPKTTTTAKQYSAVNRSEPPRYLNQSNTRDDEPIYEEPTPLSIKTPVHIRC